jgi:hypothetical protein
MGQGPPQVFSGITPEMYGQLLEKARASGIEMIGNSGTASKYGVEMSWNYSPEAQQLTVQCLRTPIFVSAASVYGKLRELVKNNAAIG